MSPQAAPQTPIQQAPAENPLDQLKDIHLPGPVDLFPSAPGWWIVLAIILFTSGYLIFRRYQYKKAIRLLKPARQELSQLRALPSQQVGAQSIATLSALLKRICLVYFPNLEVASLTGKNWLQFLNKQVKQTKSVATFFDEKDIKLFSETPYQKQPNISEYDWKSLLDASESCITQIIVKAANNKNKQGASR